MRVAVLDIEPIEPALGGSRLRLAGLYHGLGAGFDTTYVGAYHWPGPKFRRIRHGPNFEEITVPFSDRHFSAARVLQANTGDYSIIDASFPLLGAFSEDYCRHVQSAAAAADIVIFSHPWAWAVASDVVRRDRQLIVYDAHNVEGIIKRQLLGATAVGRMLADEVERLERDLCQSADLVLACSQQDRCTLAQTYDLPFAKLRVCPNGVSARSITPASWMNRVVAKARLHLGVGPIALFIGGLYPPNIEAAEFIRDRLAPACPRVTFAIELGFPTNLTMLLCPAYLRGEAYLMLHNGNRAAAEFQKFVDRRGLVANFPWGALARLGLARAYALQGDTAKARAAYQDFLTLWKDADPDVPILKQAKTEYAQLQ